MAASATGRPRPRRRSRLRGPPLCFYLRPHLLLPQLHCFVVTFDRSAGRLLPGPAVPLQQPPCPLHRVADVEQPPDQRLHPCQRPTLIRPPMSERTALQLALELRDLSCGKSRTTWRPLGPDTFLTSLPPLPAPALHRPLAHPQRGRDLPVLRALLEAADRLQPDPFPRRPLGVGQTAALRVSHTTQLPTRLSRCQPNGPTSPNQVQ